MAQVADLMAFGQHFTVAALLGFVSATPAGAGTTQAAGTALLKQSLNVISTLTGASAEAFRLPSDAEIGTFVIVRNAHASAAAKIFPHVGGAIDAGATDAVYSLAAAKTVVLVKTGALQWYTLLGA